jgi:hypothetical protein
MLAYRDAGDALEESEGKYEGQGSLNRNLFIK